jgi:hypothetical protein
MLPSGRTPSGHVAFAPVHVAPLHWRRAAKLDERQRAAIGLKVRHKGSGRLKMPGYDALNDLMNQIDPKAYSAALTEWLQANTGILPRSLAFDGKSIGNGDCGMILLR